MFSAPTFSLQLRIKESRDKLITSFRNFEFGAYNPVLSECFGVDAILDPGSGIEALFPPRPPGRPKKIRLEAQKDNKASSTARVLDIIGQAIDSKTKEIYVLVHWDNSANENDITWTFLRHLSPSTLSWWASESERRFPHIDLVKDAHRMRITMDAVLFEFDFSSEDSSE